MHADHTLRKRLPALLDGERREADDRRLRAHSFSDWKFSYRGKRQASRRGGEQPAFVDLYEPRLMVVSLAILALSILDAAFTLTLIQAGVAEEANPVLRWLISHDVQIFVNLKIVITSAGILFLLVCSHAPVFRRHRGRTVLHAVLLLYLLVIGYELILMRQIPA